MAKHTLKSCGVHTAKFLKYVWPFYNIMHERVKKLTATKIQKAESGLSQNIHDAAIF